MNPTLQDGDRVLVIKFKRPISLFKNKVVLTNLKLVSHLPEPKPSIVVKRLVALPKEHIIFLSPNNTYDELIIPDNHYFLQSDNNSADSRFWGPIPFNAFVGIVIFKLSSKATNEEINKFVQENIGKSK